MEQQYESLSGTDPFYRSTAERLAVKLESQVISLLTNDFLDSRLQYLTLTQPATNPNDAVSKAYVDAAVSQVVAGTAPPVAAGTGLGFANSTFSVLTSPSVGVDGQNRLVIPNASIGSSQIGTGVLQLSNTTDSNGRTNGALVVAGGLAVAKHVCSESLSLRSNGGAMNSNSRIGFWPWESRPGGASSEIVAVDVDSGSYLSFRAASGSASLVPQEVLRAEMSVLTASVPLVLGNDAIISTHATRLGQVQNLISAAVNTRELPLSFTGNLTRSGNTVSISNIPTFQTVIVSDPVLDPDVVNLRTLNARLGQATNGLQGQITPGLNLLFSGNNQLGTVANPVFSGQVQAASASTSGALTTLGQVQSLLSAKQDPIQVTGGNLSLSGTTLGTTSNQNHSQLSVNSTEQSTSTTTGALRVAGGIAVAKDVYSSGSLVLDTPGGANLKLFSPTGGAGNECRIDMAPWTGRAGNSTSGKASVQIAAVDDGDFSAVLVFRKAVGQSGAMLERARVDAGGMLVTGHVRCSSAATQPEHLVNKAGLDAAISAIPPPSPAVPVLYNTSTMSWNVNLNSSDFQTRAGGETSNLAFANQGTSPQFTYPDRGVFVPSFSGLVDIQFYFLDRGGSGSCSLTLTMTRDDLSGGERVATVFFHNVTGASIDWASGVCRVENGVRYFFQGRSNGITSPAPAVEVKMRRLL